MQRQCLMLDSERVSYLKFMHVDPPTAVMESAKKMLFEPSWEPAPKEEE